MTQYVLQVRRYNVVHVVLGFVQVGGSIDG